MTPLIYSIKRNVMLNTEFPSIISAGTRIDENIFICTPPSKY